MFVADPLPPPKVPAHVFEGSKSPEEIAYEIYPVNEFPQLAGLPTSGGTPADILFQDASVAVIWGIDGNPLTIKDPLGSHPILRGTKIDIAVNSVNNRLKGIPVKVSELLNVPTFWSQFQSTEIYKDPNGVLLEEARQGGKIINQGIALNAQFWGEVFGIDPDDWPKIFGIGGASFLAIASVFAAWKLGFFSGSE